MKKTIKLLSLLLVCAFLMMLCACDNGAPGVSNVGKTEDGKLVWYLGGNSIMDQDAKPEPFFEGVEDTINPEQIYNATQFTADMIHGVYTLNDKDKDLKTVRKEIPFEDVQFYNGTHNITILPVAVYLGAENICSTQTKYKYGEFKTIKEHEVAVLEFATADQIGQTPCIYEVDGNNITFKQVKQTSTGEEPFAYELTGVEFKYTFKLSGPYMTFTKDRNSLKLKAFCLTKNTDQKLSMHGYSLHDSPLIHELDYFSSSGMFNYAVRRDGSYFDRAAYKIDDEGRFTVYLSETDMVSGETEKIIGQYAYIMQSGAGAFFGADFSIILLDGSKAYYYTDDITDREARALEEQGVEVENMTEEEIKDIAEKKADLFDEMQKEFEAKGINATVNRATGEIALDATVLFAVNESAVSDDGKAFLQKFMDVYTTVVFGEKYKGFISKIMIEGHTDPTGSYELNQTLSKARADSVKDYCLSAECGVDAAYLTTLQGMTETIGYSCDKPIYDANGEVDLAASRRVAFRFIINVEKQGQISE
ncbi:MAG: OmpA family protein [Clostridia bacterium]|nr:OmpA family protein [Clostridia bacterium]